jgi:nucleotide-binding universal stress UspA family protein
VSASLQLGGRGADQRSGGEAPDPSTLIVESVLLASEDGRFSREAIALAVRLAAGARAPVHVLTIARIWGTSLGFPSPGLYPRKHEWDEARETIAKVIRRLEDRGIEADGRVIGSRNASKRITKEAKRLGCSAIVMTADEPRNRFVGNFMWSQEPQRVRRRAGVPVYLVTSP